MKKSGKIALGFLIIAAIVIPTTFLVYKNAYEQLIIEEDGIIVDDVSSGLSGYEIDLRLNMSIESPTGIPLSVDGGTYKVEFDDVKVGDGTFGPFTAKETPSNFITEINITIGIDLWQSITNLALGNDVVVKITILTVEIYGISIDINKAQEDTININDYI